jgi:hypothetical protein
MIARSARRAALLGACIALGAAGVARADQVIGDDQIVQGDSCVGLDCVDGEAFGADTVRLKENNTRLDFNDTSAAPGDPANDWEVTANDSANLGESYLGVLDVTAGRRVLRVMAGAPADTLAVARGGSVSLGRGAVVERVNGASTENLAGFDAVALLAALRGLAIQTYDDPSGARRIGPTAAAFNAAFGVGAGDDVAVDDLAGVALAADQQLATLVAAASPGAAGATGDAGREGPKGPTGDAGPPGRQTRDLAPSDAALAAFNARLDKVAVSQTTVRRRTAAMRKRVGTMR